MNQLSIWGSQAAFLERLQSRKHVLDDNRNLTLEHCSDEEFLEYFFAVGILKDNRTFSPHTIKAYRSDAKTFLSFLDAHSLTFRDIGFPEVKTYNRFIIQSYKPKSAVRKLEFFRRFLEFGFNTRFFSARLSVWIQIYSIYNKLDPGADKKRLSYAALYKIVKEAVSLAGSDSAVSPHWFRHTFVTSLLEQDVPLAVVKDLAGHADISITNLYLERIQEDRMHDHLKNVRF
ncbi:hypothetical protein BTO30_14080 [Domibacillus antri]|uniref:Integrase n=1 Tax=Domibacillus antri TaxID=1714264 RepID=A0A1Q8Q2P3_9BACI|nr:tyrosine-type recombinase/integrase [Domibacillus antri]OLN21606.1 hypothetical protein BTO30_14080 [Domibacillus antri]